jgi:hypothetical protein
MTLMMREKCSWASWLALEAMVPERFACRSAFILGMFRTERVRDNSYTSNSGRHDMTVQTSFTFVGFPGVTPRCSGSAGTFTCNCLAMVRPIGAHSIAIDLARACSAVALRSLLLFTCAAFVVAAV